jgi:hypothetical protein
MLSSAAGFNRHLNADRWIVSMQGNSGKWRRATIVQTSPQCMGELLRKQHSPAGFALEDRVGTHDLNLSIGA